MNAKYLLFQMFFLTSVFVNLFVQKNLFLKILLTVLLFLYGLLILPEFKYNKNKFLFTGVGFIVISILFLISGYIASANYLVIVFCVLVAFLYSSKVIFNTTYGEVIITSPKNIQVRILDVLYKYNKIYTIESTKKIPLNSLVSLKLGLSLPRKPISVIAIICNNSKTLQKTTNIQKKSKKAIKTRKNTNISKKKKK